MSSEPDAYGYMGTGMGLIAAAICVFVWTAIPWDVQVLVLALSLFGGGLLFFMVGKAYEREVIEEELADGS